MTQDAFTIFHIANELNAIIENARVERINQPEKDSVTFRIRSNGSNYVLTACAKAEYARLSLGKNNPTAPIEAPSFCMLLRKHLSNSTIISVSPVTDERIIKIDFLCKSELGDLSEKSLYCEIMGKYSNIVLTENGKILGALKTTSLDSGYPRHIFAGVTYALPEKQNKVSVFNENESKSILKKFNGDNLSDYLFNNFLGLSMQTAKEIVFRYFKNIKTFNIDDFYSFFKDFYVNPPFCPNAIFSKENGGVYVFDYETIEGEKKTYSNINQAIDEYYFSKILSNAFSVRKNKLTDTVKAFIKKQEKKLQIVEEKILSCRDAEKNLLFGQLIISNLFKIKGGEKYVELNDYTKDDYPLVKITLDENKSAKQNAEKYFKKYDKQKKTLSAVTKQKEELEELISYLKGIINEIEQTESIEDFADVDEELKSLGILKQENKKKEKVKQTSYRHYSYRGYEIFVGKNNVQNERLTFSADRADVWLHAKDFHSAHVIIKTNGKPVEDEVLLFAAQICAYYSDARSVDKVPVDYTLKKYVKKSNGKAIGLVYYAEQKTLYVTPDAHLN